MLLEHFMTIFDKFCTVQISINLMVQMAFTLS
jgi:hypothetical protein